MKIIKALPLLLVTLDQQIKNAGGQGFNYKVDVVHLDKSFSCHYVFEIEGGEFITLETRNSYQVGRVDDYYVDFNGDTNEYTLVNITKAKNCSFGISGSNEGIISYNGSGSVDISPCTITTKHFPRMLWSTSIGFDYEAMFKNLKQMWPKRVNWTLSNPETILKLQEIFKRVK